ncbi:Disease resistance protein (TIR-NBS-LRR class) [Arabidopsis thaliana]|nr:Disease resistance protein (TIR-NBS-LRR class) [Arabidopsis thaliana]ANM66558.1 Disease resistance protein (TIR-NBS-LRR class) [Arabidopsis thaliana]|eukprot:NP_001328444.1 Disease resistance protein (TIR-NBS-LRR class) [Arabidopsis thaliana]
MAFASSSSSIVLSKCEFDVFVSFRGADTRHDFTSHLVKYLRGKGIDVFSDAKLRGGEYISLLFDRIEQSKMSIVVFSEDYANSWWCLEEVGKIMQRRKEFNHGVLPIFYKVSKSDVSNQTGSFEAVFQSPTKIFNGDEQKIEELKVALKTASNIRGFVYPENSSEPDFLDEIVKNTFRMLNELSPCVIPDDLPGIESRSKELEKLLMFDNDECVRVVGVLGMTGIGKTTVADIVYKQNFQRFDGYEFLEDIEDNSKRYGLPYLYQKLLHKLLDGENVDVRAQGRPENFLRNKKLFIVLDNVTEEKQIEYLIGKKNVYRQGSRIVIITRDKKLLQKNADATYVVPRLNDREAMELFCLQVFGNHYPTEEFVDLSNDFVCYAKGLPLALKLLGKGLLTHDINYWKKKLEFLQVNPDKELQKELKSSYKALDDDQKSVFLDIACFFRSEKADFVSSILKSDDIDAKDVMRELEEKCLVTISYDRIEMHDLLHAMGKEIGKEKSIRKAGERRRLWNHKDIRDILEHNTGTECVRGIFLNMSEVRRIKLFPAAFTMLSKLKFLKFHSSHCSQWCDNDHIFQCSKVPDHFPDELVYLHWQGYPYDCLPSDFDPKELVDLSLRYSHIKQLWEDEKNTESLRWVDLGQSKDLLNLSGLSRAKNLERLDLEGCTSLDLLGSVKQMNELIYLNLRDCTSLESLPKGFKIKSLKTLILSGCLKLKDFHIISESIESLHLEGTAIERVVEHIESLHSLILLNLKNCEKLKYLPNDLYKLKSLQELVLSGCSALESLPPIKEKMECLEILLMDGTSIKQTPEMSCLSNLKICSFCRPVIDDSTG